MLLKNAGRRRALCELGDVAGLPARDGLARGPGLDGVVRDRARRGPIRPAATGLLQSTLGNLPELFVALFALQKGERVVAQGAIVGSLLATALLVLGLVLVVGALRAGGLVEFDPKVAARAARRHFHC